MAIRCTITASGVVNEYGQLLAIGTIYTPNNDDYALALISQKRATDTDDFLGERTNAPFDEVVYPEIPAGFATDASNNVTGLEGPDGNAVNLWELNTTPATEKLRGGESVVGWTLTNNGGATATMAMDSASPLGYPAVKITFPNDTGSADIAATGLGLQNFTAGVGKVVVHVYVADELGLKQIRPYVGISGLGRNMDRTYNLSNSNTFRANGNHIIDVHPNNVASNTLLTTDEVDTVRLTCNAQPAGGAFWIGGIYVPTPSEEQWMVVGFDDADLSMYTRLYPAMTARRLKFTLNVNFDDVGTNPALFVTTTQLDEMYAYGCDITSHNRTNTAYPDENPPTAQPSDANRLTYATEFRYARAQWQTRGYARALGFHAYVQGAFDGALTDTMRSHGMTKGRPASNDKNVEPFMLDKQLILSQRALGSGSSYATAQGWVTQAVARKQDVLLMGHVLADTASNSVTWAETDFKNLLDYALAQGMRVGSVSEWARARGFSV